MRLTRLRLNGFKSFVDPTDLVIAEGLTGVVGPNGCGKSNLLEALRWVMGENRPTAMRGGEMEDVIFAGAASRPARHFAEVALVIDNADRLAPVAFNDADTLEVVRRITREAGSAYKLQGREVRARDVQMLFADAATGAHSPALVRQGQISELINARPQARRRVLEDAAGIAGLYQRRHEAELKLKGAEANLARVDDVIAGLAGQLAVLARAARVAARYREIAGALRRAEALLLWRRWHDAAAGLEAADHALRAALLAAGVAERTAQEAGRTSTAAAAALPPLRDEAAIAGAVLQRIRVEVEGLTQDQTRAVQAIADLDARLADLDRDAAREAALRQDAGASAQRLDEEEVYLRRAMAGHDDRMAQAGAAAEGAAAALSAGESALTRLTEDAARLAAQHQSADRLITEAQARLIRGQAEAARAGTAWNAATAATHAAAAALATARGGEGRAAATAALAERTLTEAETARAATQGREAEARARAAATEGEAGALRAEVAALTRLVARESGARGQMVDLVTVAPGFETALGAALADDLNAPLAQGAGTGWAALPALQDTAPLPPGAQPLADVVTGPPALARRLSQTGLVPRDRGAALHGALRPGQRLVSVQGDLWRWDGYQAAAEDSPSAAALRLQQLNRLVAIKHDLEDAAARAQGARAAYDLLAAESRALTDAEARARAARREADRQMTEAARAVSRAEADESLATGRAEAAALAEARHRDEATEAGSALALARDQLAALPPLQAARVAAGAARLAADQARAAMMATRTAQDDLRREGEGRTRRLSGIARDRAGWTERLANADARAAELAQRRAGLEAERKDAAALPGQLAARGAQLADAGLAAKARQALATAALDAGEAALAAAQGAERAAERAASDAREVRARAEVQRDTAAALLAEALDRIGPDQTPAALLAQAGDTPVPTADALETDVATCKRQRDALGPVNLRADEDAAQLHAEHDRLVADKTDLTEAIRALRGGIGSLNREGRERLLTAFEQVNANFALLFKHLFGGGEAKLALVESDDPLEAGLEIMCQPPGKKLSVLSLLSGGEQTLTALALIFGVFLANPAPICVLDEVDAPLDDANVTRFCDLLDEMARRTETRFLVITHHAVTMARMDRLFGVTMAEQGVSQLVSVDLRRAAALVA